MLPTKLPSVLRKLSLALSLTSLVLIAAFAVSCGSSSNSIKTCTGGPYNVVGDWTLSFNGASGPGIIDTSGLAVFFQTTTTVPAPGDTIVIPAITGTCSFSGLASFYGTPASGGGTSTNTITGNVNSATSISGTAGSTNISFTATPNAALTGSPSALMTTLQGIVQGAATADILTVQVAPATGGNPANMTLTGSDGFNCTLSGTFTQQGSATAVLNVFTTSITFSGTGCPTTGTLTGLGFESSTDYFGFTVTGGTQLTGTYLYAMSSSSAAVLELYPLPIASHANKN